MGRASRKKQQRRDELTAQPTADVDEIEQLTEAMRSLTAAYEHVRVLANKFGAAYDLDITSSALGAASPSSGGFWGSEDPYPESLAQVLFYARDLIEDGVLVAPTTERGYRWEPPLTLEKFFDQIELATDDDPTYSEAVETNRALLLDRLQKIDTAAQLLCAECGHRGVYLPVDQAASRCYLHIADDELAQTQHVWDETVATIDCPGCAAPRGKMCSEDGRRLAAVDGRWPRIRKFRGRTVHKERLDLYASNPTSD